MRAIALIESPGHVCGRYRIRAFASALAESGWSLSVSGIERGPLARLRQFDWAGSADAVILQRKLLPGWQLDRLRRRARALLFDFDDAVLYRDSYQARGPHSWRRAGRFGRTVRASDAVLAGNGFLADCARIHGARADRVRVLPTCIATDRYRPQPDSPRRGSITRLVWIGSTSTLQGIEQRRPLLERLGREVPDLRLRLISNRFPRFDPLPVEAVPWSEAGEAAAIAGGDIGISWIPDDLWSRGKCGLKVLQYGAAGLPTVANPVGVHPEILVEDATGLLASSDNEWVAAIDRLARDPGLRLVMGRAARERVASSYSVAAWSGAFVAAISGAGLIAAPRLIPGLPPVVREAGNR